MVMVVTVKVELNEVDWDTHRRQRGDGVRNREKKVRERGRFTRARNKNILGKSMIIDLAIYKLM
jgi:hypothetical protein